ncbi:MAG: secondary thiamine-phosphate synthase enzyme YjbQ [Rhodospirillum sp.]|nr:secondary thiamine-phosphate synthase enzyme YjbQ [Rhodospirillum sp.]MCF8489869.1 secondary thiamine-phosphate synthase enzyme YjbQ [Rhodospirillum sp.]MCF8499432.1 secondary thiamine-phosphate synthase enzyme YjbQ [Rhodospirillum sp.]
MTPITHQDQTLLSVETRGRGFRDITTSVRAWVGESGLSSGLLTLFVRHTSASLTIQENADPDVMADLDDALARLAPEDQGLYRHALEGPDDMPAHIRAALTASSLSIPVRDGCLALGTWQGIYLCEHRAKPHRRQVVLHLIGG